MRLACVLVVMAGLVGCVAAAAQTNEPQAAATLQLTAREVVMDIVALDARGHSVQGLSASDFRIVEDGVPQKIRSVSEHRAMTAEEIAKVSPVAMPPNTFTNFVKPGNTNSGNVFAIFQMEASGMHLVQGFTSDPAMLLKAVESKRDSVVMRPPMVYRKERKEILNEGMREMGRYLAGFPGRKNLIWFAGEVPRAVFGLKANPFPDAVDYDMSSSQAANALSLSRIAMYAIDDRGLEMRWHPLNQMELERVANATGGKAFFNTNGLKEALTEITETGSNYYTIAYAPTNPEWHGHHRGLGRAMPGRPDVKLLYRHRYYARKEGKAQRVADQKKPSEAQPANQEAENAEQGEPPSGKEDFATSMQLGQMPAGELLFSVSVTPAKTAMKLAKNEVPPPGSLLRADFQRKPFRQY